MAAINPEVHRAQTFNLREMEEIRLRRSLRPELILIEEALDSLQLNSDPFTEDINPWLFEFYAALRPTADFFAVRNQYRSQLLEILDAHALPHHPAFSVLALWLRRHGVRIEIPEPPAPLAPRNVTHILLERQRGRERREEQQRLFRQQIANAAAELQRAAVRNELADYQGRVERFENETDAAIGQLEENDAERQEELNALMPALNGQMDVIERDVNARDAEIEENKARLAKAGDLNKKLADQIADLEREKEKKKKKRRKSNAFEMQSSLQAPAPLEPMWPTLP